MGASWAQAIRTSMSAKACHAHTGRQHPAVPELRLTDATLFYEQTGNGPDVLWLAAGDHPGPNWRRYQTPAFEPVTAARPTTPAGWARPDQRAERRGRSRPTPRTPRR